MSDGHEADRRVSVTMMTVTCGEAHIGAYYASCEPMKRKLNKGCTYQDKWTITTQY